MSDKIAEPHFKPIPGLVPCSAGTFQPVKDPRSQPSAPFSREQMIFSLSRATATRAGRDRSAGAESASLANFTSRADLPKPSLISSAHGEIARLLLTIPDYAGEPSLARIYRDLIAKLPKSVAYTVLTTTSLAHEVAGWFEEVGVPLDLRVVDDLLRFTVWAEDPYVAVSYDGQAETHLIEPVSYARYGDELIADRLGRSGGPANDQAPVYFQGGNILTGDDFFMIGSDYPAKNLALIGSLLDVRGYAKPEDAVAESFRSYLDSRRDLLYVGSSLRIPKETCRPIQVDGEDWTEIVHFGNLEDTFQPIFHIDMFITLAGRNPDGRYQLVVGCPRMAACLLGVDLWPNALADVFDDIAENVLDKALGFKVIRNPLPLVYCDDPHRKERKWYFASGNNALVEITGQTRRVWLPSYGYGHWETLQVTDRANVEIWKDLDFEVTLLGDCHPLAASNGSIHCIKKYLERG